MNKKIHFVAALTFTCLLLFSSCKNRFIDDLQQGDVYVNSEILNNPNIDYNSVIPILAFRVDEILGDNLYLQYRIGKEVHLHEDFTFTEQSGQLTSINNLLLAPFGQNKGQVIISSPTLNKAGILELRISGSADHYIFTRTHTDVIDINTLRNDYFSEDGFELFN